VLFLQNLLCVRTFGLNIFSRRLIPKLIDVHDLFILFYFCILVDFGCAIMIHKALCANATIASGAKCLHGTLWMGGFQGVLEIDG
jgi:hypothetical protein